MQDTQRLPSKVRWSWLAAEGGFRERELRLRGMRPDGRDVGLEEGSLTWVAFNYRGGPRGGEKEKGRRSVRGLRGVVGRGSGRVGLGVAAARKGTDERGVRAVREEEVGVAIAVEVGLVRRKACGVGGGVMQDGACERRHGSCSIDGGCSGRIRRGWVQSTRRSAGKSQNLRVGGG